MLELNYRQSVAFHTALTAIARIVGLLHLTALWPSTIQLTRMLGFCSNQAPCLLSQHLQTTFTFSLLDLHHRQVLLGPFCDIGYGLVMAQQVVNRTRINLVHVLQRLPPPVLVDWVSVCFSLVWFSCRLLSVIAHNDIFSFASSKRAQCLFRTKC